MCNTNPTVLIISSAACSYNLRARAKGAFFGFLGMLLPFVLFLNFLASSGARGTLEKMVGKEVAQNIHVYTVSTCALHKFINVLI